MQKFRVYWMFCGGHTSYSSWVDAIDEDRARDVIFNMHPNSNIHITHVIPKGEDTMKVRKPITPEKFIEIWQTSKSGTEAAKRLGVPVGTAHSRATFYRKKGIPLMKHSGQGVQGRKKLNISKLTKLAKEKAKENPHVAN